MRREKSGGKDISLRSNKRAKILICSDITVVHLAIWKSEIHSSIQISIAISSKGCESNLSPISPYFNISIYWILKIILTMDITQGRVQKKSSLKISFEIHSQNLFTKIQRRIKSLFSGELEIGKRIFIRPWIESDLYIYIYLETTSSTPSTPGSIHRSSFMSLGKKNFAHWKNSFSWDRRWPVSSKDFLRDIVQGGD